ncbi:hypothetical protein EV426DRAFT_644909 [Tirmania nivea]|nr:hypothetical protein EV426DRAFT_644909 [Tirmania nivea]
MDQRFPLQASIPGQHRTDSLPDLNIVPINSRSTSASPITATENPWQSSTSRSPSPQPASPPQIGPAVFPSRPYSPQFASSFSPPNLHQYNNLLPPTIPDLEQPTPLTNPLPFQHEYRNQVPIEGEYPGAVPVQDDTILPAPPPYSRYASGAPQKSEPERRRPQLEMIDVSSAVRGLPTVHIAVDLDGNVTSSINSRLPSGSDVAPAEPFVIQHSDSEVSMQSTQSSALSTNSNRLLMSGGLSEKVKKEKVKDNNKRVCGIKLWWILLAIALVSILLSIVLGVTLGMVLKHNQKSEEFSPQDGGNLPNDSPNLFFPNGDILVHFVLANQNGTCLTSNSTLPGLTSEVENIFWVCDIPRRQLHFEIKANDYSRDSFPPTTLPHRVGTAGEAELVITSTARAPKPIGPSDDRKQTLIYEGVQPPSFLHQPLYRVLEDNGALESKDFKKGSAGGSLKYEFQLLYTKEIILRDSTIERHSMGVESTEIRSGEIIWWCKWEKTYIAGRVWMETGNGTSRDADSAFHMTLHESRLSDQELQQLFSGSNTADAGKGAITCQKKTSNDGGGLVDSPAGEAGTGASIPREINKAKMLSEAQAVEEIVRRRFGRGSNFRPHSPQSQLAERADGTGQCFCEWVRDMKAPLWP